MGKIHEEILTESPRKVSKPVSRRLILCLNTLIKESQSAFDYLEAFSYENESRSVWFFCKLNRTPNISFLDDLLDIQAH